ncbi:hypothetical protein [Rufibacter latericius]|uniref:Uncharacterized protein n=1 Tax=Rufibacter latericius TaxID=2487040 RepID=A0A3M9MD50_9BACT|nr:hypothetical protein [Rufibacter latericius]RNI23482.1 hypothetical protein EFB08_18270 [Rufibacter latericius]
MKQPLLIIFLGVLGVLVFGLAQPATAQTSFTTQSQQKREVRNSLKEAKKVESAYSESHLDVSAYNFRKGESGRKLKKKKKRDQMPISEDGSAVIKPKVFSKKNALARVKKS